MKKNITVLIIINLIIFDQLIKWWMIHYHPLLIFRNYGIVFGLFKNWFIVYSLICIGIIVLSWVIISQKKQLSRLTHHLGGVDFFHLRGERSECVSRELTNLSYIFPIILITAGAISNIIDRFFRGYVLDYINFFGLNTFNFADILIVAGVVLYTYKVLNRIDK